VSAALLGGALRIRPHGWIVGPSGAGKTTLQQFLRLLMGDWAVSTEDATEAGVRQLLDQDTLAVMFDEIEAEADNHDVVMRIVRLARLAYSGASSLRGSSDHQAKQFVARSCFLFSSIHHHELPAQDRNRIAILALSPFAKDTPQFIVPELAKEWGDQLRRRLIEQWPRFDATLAYYQAEMLRQGYSGREQDTYGTLLSCGDLLLHDDAPDALKAMGRAQEKVRDLGVLVDAARTEAEDTSERCVKHLASQRLTAAGGQPQETVARWIQKLIIRIHNNGGFQADPREARRPRHSRRSPETGPRGHAGRAGRRLCDGQRGRQALADVGRGRQQDQPGHARDFRGLELAGRRVDASAGADQRRLGQQEVALRRRRQSRGLHIGADRRARRRRQRDRRGRGAARVARAADRAPVEAVKAMQRRW
jgi:hypothetical protein